MKPNPNRFVNEMAHAHIQALKSLAGYKFWMFGYWAAVWVHTRKLSGYKVANPFKEFVELARKILQRMEDE
jgi:hypothetical protein